jgi:DNA-3-methyladenine glycosylase I
VNERVRCAWAGGSAAEADYHDTVWGVPERDPRRLFEFLTLEGAQAGLSWRTILLKRQGYADAFAGFDPEAVARFTPADVERLMGNPAIVRNRAKIESAVGNARAWLELADPVEFVWSFVGGRPLQNARQGMGDVPASTPESEAMSKAMRRHGFRFVGTTICYAYMQACGLVNDHVVACFRHAECAALG